MSFIKNIKNAARNFTGIGLSAKEHYDRAYSRGIFLSPPDYRSASASFLKAFEIYNKEGLKDHAARALANSCLYDFVYSEDIQKFEKLIGLLSKIDTIERPNTQTEMMPAADLINELKGLIYENEAKKSTEHQIKADKFRNASEYFRLLGDKSLVLPDNDHSSADRSNAMSYAHFLMGMSFYHEANAYMKTCPEKSQGSFLQALGCFKQARHDHWISVLENKISKVSKIRHCWVCNREVQGEFVNFKYLPADVSVYFKSLLNKLRQDEGMFDRENHVTVCIVCSSVIWRQADIIAEEKTRALKQWAESIFSSYEQEIINLKSEIKSIKTELFFK